MKNLIFLLLTAIFSIQGMASDNSGKTHFQNSKAELEKLIQSNEKNKYEKAIYLIENAWYNGEIKYNNFKAVFDRHSHNIERLIRGQYNYTDYEKKELDKIEKKSITTLALEKLRINEKNYKNALANYSIYNYIKKPVIFTDSQKTIIHNPYTYSNEDPKATINWENSQVINLNNSHKGNCFALASFFKILADRFESDAKLCTAPNHIYIKHADPQGTNYNVELGTNTFPGSGHISTVTYTTNQAIKSNISQNTLTENQTLALCFVYLAKGYEFKYKDKNDKFILECAETALKYDNNSLNAMLLKAEYLENQILAHKDFAKTKELETLISKLYDLGYREMPLDMKNILVKMYQHDTITKLQQATYSQNNNQTRYASLSWGLFDERHTPKQTERYGNAIFDTKTKKITKFEKPQSTYNNYNFDPVIFALQIDPHASRYPSLSPYSAFALNPINVIDPDGRDVVFLIDNQGAGGRGHMGMLFQDKSGMWSYFTQGAAGGGSALGFISGSKFTGGVGIVPMQTVTNSGEVINMTKEQAIESLLTGRTDAGSVYDKTLTLKTTPTQDAQITNNAYSLKNDFDKGKEKYNVYTNNCTDAVQDVVEGTKGTNTGINLPNDGDPRPNEYFKTLQNSVPFMNGEMKIETPKSGLDNYPAQPIIVPVKDETKKPN